MVDGQPVVLTSPADAIRPNIGIGLVPEDRKTEGLFLKLNGRQNVSLPVDRALHPRRPDRRKPPKPRRALRSL